MKHVFFRQYPIPFFQHSPIPLLIAVMLCMLAGSVSADQYQSTWSWVIPQNKKATHYNWKCPWGGRIIGGSARVSVPNFNLPPDIRITGQGMAANPLSYWATVQNDNDLFACNLYITVVCQR